jgi:hypothetical protein
MPSKEVKTMTENTAQSDGDSWEYKLPFNGDEVVMLFLLGGQQVVGKVREYGIDEFLGEYLTIEAPLLHQLISTPNGLVPALLPFMGHSVKLYVSSIGGYTDKLDSSLKSTYIKRVTGIEVASEVPKRADIVIK